MGDAAQLRTLTGPTVRFYWGAGDRGRSSEGSPVMAGSTPLRTILASVSQYAAASSEVATGADSEVSSIIA